MSKYQVTIGLEIHVETKTKTKMFSSAPNNYSATPNVNVSVVDMAFPGVLPTINLEAVRNAIQLSHALNMKIDPLVRFDRKNYFYSDLPKGYQITQQFFPIGSNGFLDVEVNNEIKRVDIERLHMEEDTAKQLHFDDYTLLNFNRAGVPLVEIVTKPCINDSATAQEFVDKIRETIIYLEVGDGKMEEGSLRCDVNISLAPLGQTKLGTKVEIKNINSLSFIKKAIDFEIERQSKILDDGGLIAQETRRYDQSTRETVLMRTKKDAIDYKYFPEPNLLPYRLKAAFIAETIAASKELASIKSERYQKLGVSKTQAKIILRNKEMAAYFDALLLQTDAIKELTNFFLGEFLGYLNKNNLNLSDLEFSQKHFASLMTLLGKGQISYSEAKEFFYRLVKEDLDPLTVFKDKDQAVDVLEVKNAMREVLARFPEETKKARDNNMALFGFLTGQCIKALNGKINPKEIAKLLKELLEE
ncbi:MAG: Asp-tRNA(Asn)/Glu-tRNA(Gln) amidotransferase subunit GatB [Erysipelotrichaceae bacterium]|jgi:aspartyl-tRNA(Asn)/glutamyl-tRNA(Gln) amidotransferase subunit B|nr:Asp-tRNA(Asn)/Glu-tRNA(Gln) amidotransferase subunit GatB [Erysipelotrichaceae bacterium]